LGLEERIENVQDGVSSARLAHLRWLVQLDPLEWSPGRWSVRGLYHVLCTVGVPPPPRSSWQLGCYLCFGTDCNSGQEPGSPISRRDAMWQILLLASTKYLRTPVSFQCSPNRPSIRVLHTPSSCLVAPPTSLAAFKHCWLFLCWPRPTPTRASVWPHRPRLVLRRWCARAATLQFLCLCFGNESPSPSPAARTETQNRRRSAASERIENAATDDDMMGQQQPQTNAHDLGA
jgi:hypothetical protein